MTTPPTTAGNFLSSEHWVHTQDPSGRELFILSGTCILNPPLQGPQDGSRWHRGQGAFEIPLRGLPTGQGLVVEQWAPTVLLGSIQNEHTAVDAGWAVDDFDLLRSAEAVSAVEVVFDWAVGDTDGYLMRITYQVTVLGHYGDLPIIQ